MKYKEMKLSFGQKFKQLRKAAKRTKAETATLLKKSEVSYKNLENDKHYPKKGLLRKIVKLYKISTAELLATGETKQFKFTDYRNIDIYKFPL